MQWDKVKNVLIVILLVVDLFLLGNFGVRVLNANRREGALEDDIKSLVSGYGLTFSSSFGLPEDKTLITLTLDRDRVAEEEMAEVMLGGGVSRTEQDDGSVRFESTNGAVEWTAEGEVHGACKITGPPTTESYAKREAKRLVEAWGLSAENEEYVSEGLAVTVTGTVAHQSVYNRRILLTFENDGTLTVSGKWSFGTPYAAARENAVNCAAADALLSFASEVGKAGDVLSMEAGYRMEADSSRRLQLTPTWKIVTSEHEYLVDCAKKTVIAPEN